MKSVAYANLSATDRQEIKTLYSDRLQRMRREHISWSIKVSEEKTTMETHEKLVGHLGPNGMGQFESSGHTESYQVPVNYKRYYYETVEAELDSCKGDDVVLKNREIVEPSGKYRRGSRTRPSESWTRTFRYAGFKGPDKTFLDQYRKLQKELESLDGKDMATPTPPVRRSVLGK